MWKNINATKAECVTGNKRTSKITWSIKLCYMYFVWKLFYEDNHKNSCLQGYCISRRYCNQVILSRHGSAASEDSSLASCTERGSSWGRRKMRLQYKGCIELVHRDLLVRIISCTFFNLLHTFHGGHKYLLYVFTRCVLCSHHNQTRWNLHIYNSLVCLALRLAVRVVYVSHFSCLHPRIPFIRHS
jgi:hypothetical protein